ncbi:T9SS type A sorting domain-containing protein [Flavobacterium silvaticum]|uniref:T9SS type A sorting domain-containing protein n=1 Tax=Flavobacterium silvaticum TaxID=1852020 RepID=A0A972JEJ9_9FLAO|nr:T9SS type A sorting domain-containing protein [Flavobacterium silvaticum]NMH26969.1 T9SS type A sorting domain-containing protein [Flavobacterium silvaticum]
MFSKLLLSGMLIFSVASKAQEVEIAGDTMLCPNSNGTAYVTSQDPIDSYQWLVRDAFTSDPFVPIPGATEATFTYSAFEYSVKEIRLGAVLFGDIYMESNILLIDGWAFLGITTMTEDDSDISTNPNDGSLMLCQGGSFDVSVMSPYTTNVLWFKNGTQVAANITTLEITGPGEYWVSGAPQECPDYVQTSLPIVVTTDPDCQLGVMNPERNAVLVYPNPVENLVKFQSGIVISAAEIINMSGQAVLKSILQTESGSFDVSGLASGIYILNLKAGNGIEHYRIIKE